MPVFVRERTRRREGCAANTARQLQAYGLDVWQLRMAHCRKLRVLAGEPAREVFRLDTPWKPFNDQVQWPPAKWPLRFAGAIYCDYRGLPAPRALFENWLKPMGCLLVADARAEPYGWGGFDVLKINCLDAGLDPHQRSAFEVLRQQAAVSNLVVTCGHHGHVVAPEEGEVQARPALGVGPVANVSGAGDTFTATLAAAMAGGVPVVEAAAVAGVAAGVRVTKAGYNVALRWEEIEPWVEASTGLPT